MAAKIKTAPRHRGHDHPFKPKKINSRAFSQVYWPYLPVIAVIVGLVSLGIRQGDLTHAIKNPSGSVLSYATSMSDQLLLSDTNQQRQSGGISSLHENPSLDAAAQSKAQDMANRDYWSHDTPDGSPPWVFVTDQHYSYQKLGENLAAGFDNEQATINGWMASPLHKENMLDPSFSEVGFGTARSADYRAAGGGPMTIVVALYGKPGASNETTVKGSASSGNVSLGQLAVAQLPVVGLTTNLLIFLAAAAVGIWLGRHLARIRKMLKKSEKYALSHPLLDVGLITIAALSYLLTRTAGLIH